MSVRVLATQEAKDRIAHMKAVIDGPFFEQIVQLDSDGTRLSDPNVWDGPLAAQFRDLWDDVHAALDEARARLDDLNRSIDTITTNILSAGGI